MALNNLCASSLDRETPSATDSLLLLKTHLCVMEQDPDGTWVHSERTWTEQPEGRTSDKRSVRTPEAESRLSASRWFPCGGHSSTSVFPCNSLSLLLSLFSLFSISSQGCSTTVLTAAECLFWSEDSLIFSLVALQNCEGAQGFYRRTPCDPGPSPPCFIGQCSSFTSDWQPIMSPAAGRAQKQHG